MTGGSWVGALVSPVPGQLFADVAGGPVGPSLAGRTATSTSGSATSCAGSAWLFRTRETAAIDA